MTEELLKETNAPETLKMDLLDAEHTSSFSKTFVVPVGALTDSAMYKITKRCADIVIATLSLLILWPVFLVIMAFIYAEDRGPMLYRQIRVGRYGKDLPFYKFRSMRIDADKLKAELLHKSDASGAAFKMKNDPRVTKVGRIIRKLSLDELPQLLMVLGGQMSVIGPRPHLPSEVETYRPDQRIRLEVKPGLICLREVRGRSHLSFEEWLKTDVEYVQNRSLWLDLKIFCLAIPAVLKGVGAY